MSVLSGKSGKIQIGASTVQDCQSWQWSRSVVELAYASCSTSGYKKRLAGVKDHSGSLKGLFDTSAPPEDYFSEGDLVTLNLFIDAVSYYIVPAMITKLDVEVDNNEGDLVPWSADFGGNGAWSSSGL